jgi:hypothetical protein
MPTIRPYNAEKGRLKRPNLAEDYSARGITNVIPTA